MTRGVLVDAGPLVAILHRDDRDHKLCVETLKRIGTPLVTTWMPVTEAMYLLAFSADAQGALLEIIERGALKVLPVDTDDVPNIRSLMHKYADLPMDFADATLVHVANREGLRDIFTLDRRDFSVYRLKRGRPFTIIPKR
ncbi:MAG: type II toxin-antitoxin system VapC family toxin [Acidiferrobacterales bacterium]